MSLHRLIGVVSIICLVGMICTSTVARSVGDTRSHATPAGSERAQDPEDRDNADAPSTYHLPGRHLSEAKLDMLRKKAGPEKRQVGPIGIERDGVYMSPDLPLEDDVRLDLGYFKAKPSKGYIGLRLRIVPKPGGFNLFGSRRSPHDGRSQSPSP